MADGSIRIDLDLEVQKAEQKLEELKQKTQDMSAEITKTDSKAIEKLSQAMEQQIEKTSNATSKVERYRQKILELQYDLGNWQEWGDMEQVENTEKRIARYQELINKTKEETLELEKQSIQADNYINKLDGINAKKDTSVSKTKALNKEADKTPKKIDKATRSSKGLGKSLGKGVTSIKKMTFALLGARTAYSLLSKITRNWLDSSDAGAQRVKAQISSITNALTNILAPVLTFLANTVMTILSYVNALLKAFFGVDLFAKSTAKNTGKIGGGLKKANKEMKKFTAGFDKAEVVSENVSDNLGGAGGGGGGAVVQPEFEAPDVSAFMEVLERLKSKWLEIWNSDTFQSIMDSLQRIASNTFNSIASIGGTIWDNLVIAWETIMPILSEGFLNLGLLYSTMLADIADFTDEWFPQFTEQINTWINTFYSIITPLAEFFVGVWRDMTQMARDIWDEYGADILEQIGKFINSAMTIANKVWGIVKDIFDPFLAEVQRIWDEHLKDLVMEVGRFVGDLVMFALRIYNEFIYPLMTWILDKLAPVFEFLAEVIFPAVGGAIGNVIDTFTNLFGSARTILNGLLDFITGVFAGNWSKAWNGIKNIIAGVFNGMVAVVKSPINAIISIVNGFIRGLNKFKAPKWVPGIGGKGINIPQIPRLASGAVLTRPTLNVAGEYAGARRNPEIVTPESKMRQVVNEALANVNLGNNQPQVIQLVVDGKKLAEVVNDINEQSNFSRNGEVVWNI